MSDASTRFFIDRRLNPGNRSLGNRQRFLRRAREQLKGQLDKMLDEQKIADPIGSKTVTVPSRGIREPRFRLGPGGKRERVLSGNKEFVVGDRIGKPQRGDGGEGSDPSEDGDGQDDFTFALTEEEFLDVFFEDLALPDLAETELRRTHETRPSRAGHASTGTTSNLDAGRTVQRSFGRRLALGRPNTQELDDLRERCDALRAAPDVAGRKEELALVETELDRLERRWRRIPYIDPSDVRYRRFEAVPDPSNAAVMFCLMDVSGSMTEDRKDLAKRFFLLLHLFLRSHYESVDLVFIRHTHEAAEVDEDTFFRAVETGGTAVSSALHEMLRIAEDRYPSSDWNIYVAQASDGDNSSSDTDVCVQLLRDRILPMTQYYAYVGVAPRGPYPWFGSDVRPLGPAFEQVAQSHQNFACASVTTATEIYPVFRKLFHQAQSTASVLS